MASFVRNHFGLTQERLAAWLGVGRGTVAMAETGDRGLGHGAIQEARLTLAALGKVLEAGGADPQLAFPPLPLPPAPREPLARRLAECQYQIFRLSREWTAMQATAQPLENRLAALPALRAYAGPVPNPARDAGWLALFEGEAVDGLRYACGAGPQRLLAARLAGLEREAEMLRELPDALPAPEQ